jgi:hypothetical protein
MFVRVKSSQRLLIVAQFLTAVIYAIPILSSDRVKGLSDFICFYASWFIVRDGRGKDGKD